MIKTSVLFAILFITNTVTHSQEQIQPNIVKADANACELNSLFADGIYTQITNKDAKIFVVAQPGIGESEAVNKRRLSLVRSFLTFRKDWDRYKPLYVIGDRTSGEGKIDVYVGSKLYWVIMASKNSGPCMDCCDFDFLSAPGNLIKSKKPTRRKKTPAP